MRKLSLYLCSTIIFPILSSGTSCSDGWSDDLSSDGEEISQRDKEISEIVTELDGAEDLSYEFTGLELSPELNKIYENQGAQGDESKALYKKLWAFIKRSFNRK